MRRRLWLVWILLAALASVASAQTVTVWADSATERVCANYAEPQSARLVAEGDTVWVECVRNEREALQLVVKPDEQLYDVEWVVLRQPVHRYFGVPIMLPDGSVRVHPIGFVEADDTTVTNPDLYGWYPDVIMWYQSSCGVKANEAQPYWVEVFVPETSFPGDYVGVLQLRHSGGVLLDTLFVGVHVRKLVIPPWNHFGCVWSLSTTGVRRAAGYSSFDDNPDMMINWANFMAHFRMPLQYIYADWTPYQAFAASVERGVLPDSQAEAVCSRLFVGHQEGGWTEDELTEEMDTRYIPMAERQVKHLVSDGVNVEEQVAWYTMDEVESDSLYKWKEALRHWRNRWNGHVYPDSAYLKVFTTAHIRVNVNARLDTFFGKHYFDVVTASAGEIRSMDKDYCKQNYPWAEIWWYLTSGPQHPNWRIINNDLIEGRMFVGYISRAWEVEYYYPNGTLYWSLFEFTTTESDTCCDNLTVYYIDDTSSRLEVDVYYGGYYRELYDGAMGAGDLVYTDDQARLYPSIRFYEIVEGYEDYELWVALDSALAWAEENDPDNEWIAHAESLRAVPDTVVHDLVDPANFSHSSAAMYYVRHDVIETIEGLFSSRSGYPVIGGRDMALCMASPQPGEVVRQGEIVTVRVHDFLNPGSTIPVDVDVGDGVWRELGVASGPLGWFYTFYWAVRDTTPTSNRVHFRIRKTGEPDRSYTTYRSVVVREMEPSVGYAIRVNCGGPDYVDRQGRLWTGDQPYTVSNWGYEYGVAFDTCEVDIGGTDEDGLFQSYRVKWSDDGRLIYRFPVNPQAYWTVRLLLADVLPDTFMRQRVLIGGDTVRAEYCLRETKGFFEADTVSYSVPAGTDTIDIWLEQAPEELIEYPGAEGHFPRLGGSYGGWQMNRSVVDEKAHSGSYSLKLGCTGEGLHYYRMGDRAGGLNGFVPGGTYVVQAYCLRSNNYNWTIGLEIDGEYQPVDTTVYGWKWQHLCGTITIPEDADTVIVMIQPHENDSAIGYFDDISVARLGAHDPAVVINAIELLGYFEPRARRPRIAVTGHTVR